MPPTKRAPAKAAAARQAPQGRFARLRAEAAKNRAPIEPYVIDDVEPPITITAPDDVERQIGILEMLGPDGDQFQVSDARRVLELLCGEEFPRVWELVRKEHISVLMELIADMGEHFGPALEAGMASAPGGSPASST